MWDNAVTRFFQMPFSTIMGGGIKVEKENDGSYFYVSNGANVEMPYRTNFEIYKAIPHLRTIVNKRIAFFSNARYKVVKPGKPGQEDQVLYDHPLAEMLKQPNFAASWQQFLAMLALYKYLDGIGYIYPGWGIAKKPSLLAWLKVVEYETKNIDINQRQNNISAQNLDELINNIEFFFENGSSVKYKPSELISVKDKFCSYTKDFSRVTAGKLFLENIYKSLVNRGILIDAKGGIGLISGNQKDGGVSVPMTKREKKRLTMRLDDYGLGRNKKPVILTDQPLKYTPMVFPTSSLMLFEEEEGDFNGLCDLYEMARELFVGDAAYASTRLQAEKDTYTNTIIPEWVDLFALLNRQLNMSLEGLRLDLDYSHIGCLQSDKGVELANQKAEQDILVVDMDKGAITIEDYKRLRGYDKAKTA